MTKLEPSDDYDVNEGEMMEVDELGDMDMKIMEEDCKMNEK